MHYIKMKCPRDNSDLEKKKTGSTCNQCNGIWLPFEEVMQLYTNCKLTVPSQVYSVEKATDCNKWDSSIRCPNDNAKLTTYEYMGIQIDICHKCGGLWLDDGEFSRLLTKDPVSVIVRGVLTFVEGLLTFHA
jgi:Zn-finger nucleic acid-binding protein